MSQPDFDFDITLGHRCGPKKGAGEAGLYTLSVGLPASQPSLPPCIPSILSQPPLPTNMCPHPSTQHHNSSNVPMEPALKSWIKQ